VAEVYSAHRRIPLPPGRPSSIRGRIGNATPAQIVPRLSFDMRTPGDFAAIISPVLGSASPIPSRRKIRAREVGEAACQDPLHMRIVLFRHGPAGQRDPVRWPDDRLRPLTPRGVRRTRLAAAGIGRLEPHLGAIVTSPLLRALATAALLKEQAGHADLEMMEALAPGGPPHAIIELLAARPATKDIALVGHEPDLGQLAGLMVFDESVSIGLKKAGACAIEFADGVRPGAGNLTWFLPPRVLRRLGRRKVNV